MSKSTQKQKKSKQSGQKAEEKSKLDYFSWTDDEVELLLNVAIDYKTTKTMENVDWESGHSKYQDILDKYKEMYPTAEDAEKLGKDFPHKKEDITKLIVTSKLKSVRVKYRQAVDSGRRSGHGRVVLLYFELCEQIWGGSPATVMVSSGIETTDMVVVMDDKDNVNEDAGDGDVVDQISQPGISTTSPASSFSDSLSESFESSNEGSKEKLPANEIKRRHLLNSKLATHKQEKLKRKIPVENQLSNCAQEDLKVKKQLLERMESTDKEYSVNMSKLSSNIEKLTNSIADGFALLRQVMLPQPTYGVAPQYIPQRQGNTVPFTHNVDGSMPPTSADPRELPVAGQFSYTQSYFSNEYNSNSNCY